MADSPISVFHQLRDQPAIFEQLSNADTSSELALQKQLRSQFSEDIVRAALQLHELRQRGAKKFSRAADMWFDRVGLEQSTHEAIGAHKAHRFSGQVVDMCCGIGGDSIALALNPDVTQITAVDRRDLACNFTSWNAETYGVEQRVQTLCADVTSVNCRDSLIHIDPDRRTGKAGQRTLRLDDCQPSLEFMNSLQDTARGGAIKLSPASNFPGKFPDAEIELISLDGECKEATVWFGELAYNTPWRATVLPANESISGDPLSVWTNVGPLQRYILDPDPAVVRAGLIDVLCEQLSLTRLDEAEEYLTSDDPVDSPFVRCFEVTADLPNNDKQIRRHFRDNPCSDIEIKCRRIPINIPAVRRKIPTGGGTQRASLIFARVADRARAIVCRRI